MKNKFNGGQASKRPNAVPNINHTKKEPPKEEFNDWPSSLLSIGIFGNKDVGREEQEIIQVERNTTTEIHEEKELKKLLKRKPAAVLKSDEQPLDRFLNCFSGLEVERSASNRFSSHSDEEEIERTIQVILGRCKDIGKKSLSFLIKKMFVCRSGFVPIPSLRDTLQESKMEKLLRTLLSKKIDCPTYSRTSSTIKYIENSWPITNADRDEEDSSSHDKSRGRSKWDMTDSDYIVLEV